MGFAEFDLGVEVDLYDFRGKVSETWPVDVGGFIA